MVKVGFERRWSVKLSLLAAVTGLMLLAITAAMTVKANVGLLALTISAQQWKCPY